MVRGRQHVRRGIVAHDDGMQREKAAHLRTMHQHELERAQRVAHLVVQLGRLDEDHMIAVVEDLGKRAATRICREHMPHALVRVHNGHGNGAVCMRASSVQTVERAFSTNVPVSTNLKSTPVYSHT